MTANLHFYLEQASRQRFARGLSDCCALAAGWIELSSGHPVESPHLGKPLSDAAASELLAAEGGLAGLARRTIAGHGWTKREGSPRDGDVVIAERQQSLSSTLLGIWSGGKLVTASRSGLRILDASELMEMEAWHGH